MKWWSATDDRRTRDRAMRWLESRGLPVEDVYLVEFFDDWSHGRDGVARVHQYDLNDNGRKYLGEDGEVAKLPVVEVALRPGEYDTIKTPGR